MDVVAAAGLSDEQRELARAIDDLAADRCSSAQLREAIELEPHWDPKLWHALAQELGVAGIAVAEEDGGAGGDFADAAVVIERAAAALMPVPITSHLVACEALKTCSEVSETLQALASGESIAALAVTSNGKPGTAERVLHGHLADVIVVLGADGVRVIPVESAGTTVSLQPSLDLTRPHATVTFDPSRHAVVADAESAARAVDVFRVALAIEAVGVAKTCLAMTVEYLKTREQFGRPIGAFQALAHRAADLAVVTEAAVATAAYATATITAGDDDELKVVAPLAKAVCCDAVATVTADTIQLHGGIGFTWEHDAHLYFKRATAIAALLGASGDQRRLVADRAGIFTASGA